MSGTRISGLWGKITVVFVICCCYLPARAKYGGGTGEPNDPYLIFTAEQMNEIGLHEEDWGKHFKLMTDIDLSEYTGTEFNIIGRWVKWGSPNNKPFIGVFDGNGHTISNFSYTSTGTNYIGLFGFIDNPNAKIKNLGLIAPDVDAGTGDYVGSLVGYLSDATVANCYVEGGSVAGNNSVGGLVGGNGGTINNCYSAGSVSGSGENVGGLVGYNWIATITNCYSNGTVLGDRVVGGLVGESYRGTITYCYSTGSVSGTTDVGGLVGYGSSGTASSLWDIETSGQLSSAGGSGLTTAQMQTASTFMGWGGCGNEGIWTLDEGNDYPHLWWEEKPGDPLPTYQLSDFMTGAGTQIDPYLIYTAEQLNMIGLFLCDWDKHFKLMAYIDLSGFRRTSFNIIGTDYYYPFAGVFDGNGHTISNFTYTTIGTDFIGLFGYVTGEIKNLGLIAPNVNVGTGINVGALVGFLGGTISNCYVEGGSVSGNDYLGGLVGKNYGTITNCYSTASVSGDNYLGGLVGFNFGTMTISYSSASVTGDNRVGGLVGENRYGTITNCYSDGSVTGDRSVGGLVGRNYHKGIITNCYSAGSVSGNQYVGGLVGSNNHGTISNCYSTANVSGFWYGIFGGLVGWNYRGTITNCYSTGSVSGDKFVGGLVGDNYEGTIANCYSTGSVTGDTKVGGLVGSHYEGTIADSFWDIETSGQATSDGGTGLPTAEMQMQVTFADAGWDFNTPVWTIDEGVDYPHLWWEGMQVPMKLTPRTLNCRSKGNWVKAHLTLPEGYTVADVDSDRPAVLHSFGFQSLPLYVFVNKDKLVEIEAAFERQAVCSLAGDWPDALTVAGFLTDGNIFLGTSNVRIIHPGMKVIEELAWYWLNADCVQPDFCNEIDMNRDSLVNLLDYALLMNIEVEFVTDE